MKVTAIIPDSLVDQVREYSQGKNITDSIIIALNEWLNLKRLRELNNQINAEPLHFELDATAIRQANRQ